MYSIEVNGALLVDEPDPGIDTVKDTPMKSYAVLSTGANGNLEATSDTSGQTTGTTKNTHEDHSFSSQR